MEYKINKNKNRSGIHFRPILSLLIGLTFFTIILIIALGEAGKSGKSSQTSKRQSDNSNEGDVFTTQVMNKKTTAIVLEVNGSSNIVRLYDITYNSELTLTYTGGTNILDKHGQVISIGQISIGLIVDVEYQSKNNKLNALKYSEKAWEYVGVNNMTIYPGNKMMKIGKSNYKYEEPYVIDNDRFATLEELAEQDELMVRGIDETIWTIVVTKGHGTVRIKDDEAFLGGSIIVGYEAVSELTKDMVITVREGSYNLTVENGLYSGTKNVTVERNLETIVSIGDLGPEPIKYGKAIFDITPFGADLYIDNVLTSYGTPIELAYGKHNIEVSLGGYSTYHGDFMVDFARKKIQIVLPELESRDPVSIVEIDEQGESFSELTGPVEYNDWDSDQRDNEDNPEHIDSLINNTDYEEDPIIDNESLIYIQNPSGASVYLNGEFKGVSPGTFKKVIGSHVLTFIKQGYKTKSYTIDISDDGLDTYINLPDLMLER